MNYTFGDIVIVDKINIGVVVKCWSHQVEARYDVYVRVDNAIRDLVPESKIRRYLVRHKYLTKRELEYQFNAENGL